MIWQELVEDWQIFPGQSVDSGERQRGFLLATTKPSGDQDETVSRQLGAKIFKRCHIL